MNQLNVTENDCADDHGWHDTAFNVVVDALCRGGKEQATQHALHDRDAERVIAALRAANLLSPCCVHARG